MDHHAENAATAVAFEPPDWACDAFLRTISAEAKMTARSHGEAGAVPRSWSMVDAVIHWWETEGRRRYQRETSPVDANTMEQRL